MRSVLKRFAATRLDTLYLMETTQMVKQLVIKRRRCGKTKQREATVER